MMMILATIVLLGVLILVHELGHFWAAKAVGVGVERFSIGLGPRVWGFTRKGTEYVLAVIPLGGYVKMQGMNDEVMEQVEGGATEAAPWEPQPGDFDEKPLWARAFVISAGVIMNILFAFVVYTAVYAFWGSQDYPTTRVYSVESDSLPAGTEALAEMAQGATVVQVGDEAPDTWGAMLDAFSDAPAGPVQVLTEEPSAVIEVESPAEEAERQRVARSLRMWLPPMVGAVDRGGPAETAGVEVGDVIFSVAGAEVSSWQELQRELWARPGERVELGLARGSAELTRVAVLDDAEGPNGERLGLLRISSLVETIDVPVGAGDAVVAGVAETVGTTALILRFLGRLFTLDVSPREVGSIGTIAVVSGRAAEAGISTYLQFMALFSINLAVLNMLPIPVLDGGHMMFLGIELVRGRKLTVKQRLRWSQVGLLVVLGIMVWALGNDILRFFGL